MDKLILQTKFENNSAEEIANFYNGINSFDRDSVTEDGLLETIEALTEQIPKYNPKYNSDDSSMLIKCVNVTKDIIEEKGTDKVYGKLVDLIKLIIQSEWTATNCELVELIGYCMPKNYFQSLTGSKLIDHMSLFNAMNLTISLSEETDNYSRIRSGQEGFAKYMFVDNFESDFVSNNKEMFQSFTKDMYMRSWNDNEDETKIYSSLTYQSESHFEMLFKTNAENFVSFYSDISDRLIKENIPTNSGKEMIERFYSVSCSIFSHQKENQELLAEKWVKSLFDLSKLKQNWMENILKSVSRQISWIDQKFQATVFKNCQYLLNEAIEYLLDLLAAYPKSTSEDETPTKDAIEEWSSLVKSMTEYFLQHTLRTTDNLKLFIPCLESLILINTPQASEIFNNSFKRIEKPMQDLFKSNPEVLISLTEKCLSAALVTGETEDRNIPFPFGIPIFDYDYYHQWVTKFGKISNAFKSPSVQESLRTYFLKAFNQFSLTISIFINNFQEFLIFTNYTPDQMVEFIQAINGLIQNPLFHIYNPKTFSLGTLMNRLLEHICLSQNKYANLGPEIINTAKLCVNIGLMWEDHNGEMTMNSNSMIILFVFQQLLITKPILSCTAELYSLLFEVINTCDESHSYYSSWISFPGIVPRKCTTPEILISKIPNIMNLAKNINESNQSGNIHSLLDGLQVIISSKPSAALEYLDDIENFILSIMNETINISLIQLLTIIYAEYPQKINEEFILNFQAKLTENDFNAYLIANLYNTISKTHPRVLISSFSKIIESLNIFKSKVAYSTIGTLTNILSYDPSLGEQVFLDFEQLIDNNNDDNALCMVILNGFRQIGLLRHDLLVKLEDKIKIWQQMNASVYDICQHLLDVIADRSLAQLDSNINQQSKELERMDNALENQKDKIETIDEEVKQQKGNIEDITKRVDDSEHQIEELKHDVEEINDQVQEIDQKTISNAPKWAREVSKLLNPPSDDDWKLLGLRLGYNSDDIRAWSTHADPCMSLLSDWFAVRRHVEATRAILEQLNEINRSDAAKIVEDALTVAESMVSDDDPIEFVTPPLIFLSYQWSNQEEVKMLREHLQKAGYRCWMDIGQMGGGDKLYEAIDRGIRGAKVFISCVTKKYSESANCKRELNLAISLQKSVIPLQMERMEWPPIGTMGPLLTEYIFIRMFGKPGMEPVSGTFWPKDRFHELLMQIRYSCAPDYELIDESYSNWWQPPEIKLNYQNKENKIVSENISEPLEEENNNNDKTPEIFISYQWGKQEEVKKLKSALTELGYHCWMDIFQMGGGDSLYDKIDKGLRGCHLMISCVTPKYAESPNCRREVSLCDSLKKPIIPIMLERMIWPPEGPMSMVLNPLSYISFVDTYEEQQSWNGQATNELLDRINKIIPGKKMAEISREVLSTIIEKQNPAKVEESINKEISSLKMSVNNNVVKTGSGSESSSSVKPNLRISYSTTCIII